MDNTLVPATKRDRNTRPRWRTLALIFALPMCAALFVVTYGPNYRSQPEDVIRTTPLGSDFMQEWVGGIIVARGQADQLYDQAFTQALQHESSLIGFHWDQREYYPMVYPPFYYWLVSPFSRLDLETAAKLWCLLNALAFSISLVWLACLGHPQMGRRTWILGAAVLFQPLLLSLGMGQKSGWILLLLVAAFAAFRADRKFWSGVAAGLLVFKPHLGLWIGLTMLWKREYRFVAGALVPLAAALLISLSMGPEACRGFWEVCLRTSSYTSQPGYALAESHSVWSVANLLGGGLAAKALTMTMAMIAIWYGGRCLRGSFEPTSDRFALQYSALILITVLLSPHFYTYDLAILLIPIVLIGSRLVPSGDRGPTLVGDLSIRKTGLQLALVALMFAGAGFFAIISAQTSVPVSVLLCLAWLYALSDELGPRPVSPSAEKVRQWAGASNSIATKRGAGLSTSLTFARRLDLECESGQGAAQQRTDEVNPDDR